MILSIAYREFRSLFLSPLAWSILAIIQFILAYLFLTQVETFTAIQAQLSAIDSSHYPDAGHAAADDAPDLRGTQK